MKVLHGIFASVVFAIAVYFLMNIVNLWPEFYYRAMLLRALAPPK